MDTLCYNPYFNVVTKAWENKRLGP
jgi:hypothetical protein